MRILNPSYKIHPLHGVTEDALLKQIEYCGRICCRSRDKITPDSAKAFVDRVIRLGHWSVLEMANIILKVEKPLASYSGLFDSPYIQKSYGVDIAYFSGSPRAFIEVIQQRPVAKQTRIVRALKQNYPFFFGSPSEDSKPQVSSVTVLTNEELKGRLRYFLERHCKVAVEFLVNRAFSHELVRHRPCSYLQESQRYCKYKDDVEFIVPQTTGSFITSDNYKVWEDAMRLAENHYKKLLNRGVSPQVARLVLPNSVATRIICYCSIEQWKHIFKQRCSSACDPNMYLLMRELKEDFNKYFSENLQ